MKEVSFNDGSSSVWFCFSIIDVGTSGTLVHNSEAKTEVYQRIASPLLTVGCKKQEENKGKKKGNDEVMSDVRMNMLKDYESTLNADNW